MKSAAVFGKGGMAPSAALATIEHFREEFEAHVRRGECPAGVCETFHGESASSFSPGVYAGGGGSRSR